MKKIICMILIISILSALVFTANVFAEGETVTVDGITYTSYDTYCELTSCDYGKSGEVVIPSSVKFGGESLPVTSIGYAAFMDCSGLTSVTIPDSVTSIGYAAFCDCSGLESINVSVKNKVYHSKGNCIIETDSKILIAGCKNSVIPDDGSVTSIGMHAFSYCSGLTSVTIPDSVMSIGYYAFECCESLTSVTIPDSVTSIGEGAFSWCSGLESINVSDKNKEYYSKENCLIETESKALIAGCKNSVIPDDGSVTSIGHAAFRGCSELTSVTIPDSVTSIGNCAFEYCSGLTSVTIPDSVTSIGSGVFNYCSSLETVYYKGSEEQWNKIYIGSHNDDLLDAEIKFDFTDPDVVIEISGGDCNGDGAIDNKDVVVLFRYVSGGNKVTDESIYDINGDGEVDNKDVVTLFRYISAL